MISIHVGTRPRLTGVRCQCRACGEYFNSTTAFDEHRIGTYAPLARRCLTRGEMLAKGFAQNGAGFWTASQMADSDRRRVANGGLRREQVSR